MKFSVWERKLKERLDIWYLAKQDEELQMVSILNGRLSFNKVGKN